jgi:hypothetical protein
VVDSDEVFCLQFNGNEWKDAKGCVFSSIQTSNEMTELVEDIGFSCPGWILYEKGRECAHFEVLEMKWIMI